VIVPPAGHPLDGRPRLLLAELATERWVQGCLSMSDLLDSYARVAGFQPRVSCRGTDYTFAQSLVRAGVGISMIPQVALAADRTDLAGVPLDQPCPTTRYVGTVTARHRRPNPLTAALQESLHRTATGAVVRAGLRGPV
jgi:DNA-binding transcriptional LysR family regulator